MNFKITDTKLMNKNPQRGCMNHICQMLTPGDELPCQHYIRPNDAKEPGFCRQPNKFRCDEAMKKKLPSISFSRLKDFIACKLRYKRRVTITRIHQN